MNKQQILLEYAKSKITEGMAAMLLCQGDRIGFRKLFDIWCLENPDVAMKSGWHMHLVNRGKSA